MPQEMVASALWCGFWNCARGRKLFNTTSSTFIGRLVATHFMGLGAMVISLGTPFHMATIMLWTWGTLLLWCTPAWDAYWSAEIGDDPNHSRLWGLAAMSLRMTLAAPCLIGLAYLTGHMDRAGYAAGSLLLGLPYYISGFVSPRKYVISIPETVVGMILGVLIFTIVS